MLKAKALCAVEGNTAPEIRPLMSAAENLKVSAAAGGKGLNGLVGSMQNMVIESVGDEDDIPAAVGQLAARMMKSNHLIKDLLLELRQLFSIRGKKEFRLSLAEKSDAEKKQIIALFQDMAGVVSNVHYCPEFQTLHGSLVITPKAQRFLNGQWLECAVYQVVKDVLQELSVKYNTEYEIYRNVCVAARNSGKSKNEFDCVVLFGSIFYIIECKSGKWSDWSSFTELGQAYGVVPDRLLLVDSYISDSRAECVEYFCDYYVCNLNNSTLREKVTKMISNDIAA